MNFLSSRRNLGFKWTQKRMGWVVPEVPEDSGVRRLIVKNLFLPIFFQPLTKCRIANVGIAEATHWFDPYSKVFFIARMQKPSASDLLVLGLLFVGMSTVAYGEPQRNAQQVNREPGLSGQSVLQGDAKTANIDIPILERDYRPLHVYGNMTRRNQYRGTVIPNHRDRVEMLQAVVTKEPVGEKYVKNRYR